MSKIRDHIEKHKTAYACIATAIGVAGITTLIMRERYATLQSGVDGSSQATVRSLNFLCKASGNIVTAMHTGDRGHPGFRVRNLETGGEFDTQGETARAFNVSPAMLSSHLNGKADNVNGLHFERIAA